MAGPTLSRPGTTEVRKIWGGLVPYGEPWRMGADEATLLITQKPIEMGGKTIPAGAYTLYMMPERKRHVQTGHQHRSWRLGNSRGHEA